jgi:NAD(P)-dependent dehydrogenase (short-subunit alcohol dehydrogenase family)
MTDLTGKTALITGASKGIGAAAARAFAAAGANVVLAARSGDAIAALAGEIGDGALAVPCDVSDPAAVAAAVAQAHDRFGGPHILVNNAGVIEPIARMADADPVAWGTPSTSTSRASSTACTRCCPVCSRRAAARC